jgi:Na+/H+ antiporter NhaD/arsenite permease-like protein
VSASPLGPATILGIDAMWVASGLLVLTYAAVISERVNRAVVALLGASLMVLLGVLTQEQALEGVDFNTIGLLIGMMVIVSVTKRTGVFEYLAVWSAKRVKANPAGIMFSLQLVTAVISALLDNVTTVLLIVPVTFVICERLKIPTYPLLVSQIFAANIGGTATLVGDPPNILIGSQVGLGFNQFVLNLGPAVVVIQLLVTLFFHLLWGRRLKATMRDRARIMTFDESRAISDRRLLVQCLAVIALVVAGFVLAELLGHEPATIALAGAASILLLSSFGKPPAEQSRLVTSSFEQVEWITIFFFIGLFIVISGVESTGLLQLLADNLLLATRGDLATTMLAVLFGSAVLSAVVDNIPFVATMIPLLKATAPAFGGPDGLLPIWWALSFGACLGGNGTLVGASANLVVAGLAERAGTRIAFLQYMKVAAPMMLITVGLAAVYLILRYL